MIQDSMVGTSSRLERTSSRLEGTSSRHAEELRESTQGPHLNIGFLKTSIRFHHSDFSNHYLIRLPKHLVRTRIIECKDFAEFGVLQTVLKVEELRKSF